MSIICDRNCLNVNSRLFDVIGSIVISLSHCCLPNDEGPYPQVFFPRTAPVFVAVQVCNSSSAGDVMTCLTPDLSTIVVSNTTADADRWPMVADVSFIMDAVGGLVSGTSPVLKYFEDPHVQQFQGSDRLRYFYDDDDYLQIEVSLVDSQVLLRI